MRRKTLQESADTAKTMLAGVVSKEYRASIMFKSYSESISTKDVIEATASGKQYKIMSIYSGRGLYSLSMEHVFCLVNEDGFLLEEEEKYVQAGYMPTLLHKDCHVHKWTEYMVDHADSLNKLNYYKGFNLGDIVIRNGKSEQYKILAFSYSNSDAVLLGALSWPNLPEFHLCSEIHHKDSKKTKEEDERDRMFAFFKSNISDPSSPWNVKNRK